MRSSRLLFSAVLALFVCGCTGGAQDGKAETMLLGIGEPLVLDARFDEAMPVLREHLLRHPFDPGAHYYLGRCYLNASEPWLFLAEGELRTALMLYRDRRQPNTIERFDDADLEQSIHVEIAKVYLRQFEIMQQINAPHDAQKALLHRLQEETDLARTLAPDSEEVRQLQALVDAARGIVERDHLRQPPSPDTRAPQGSYYEA